MKKCVLFCFTAILLFIADASPGLGQGVSTPDDLIWVAPDSSRGPALFFNDDLSFDTKSFDGHSIEIRSAMDGSFIKRSVNLAQGTDLLWLSPDNRFLATINNSTSQDKIGFYILDAHSLEILYTYHWENSPTTWDLAFSNDSKKLYRISSTLGGSKISIYDVNTWQIIKDTLVSANCQKLNFHPKGNFLALGRLDGKIEFRDPVTLILQRMYDINQDSKFFGFNMTPDGNWISFKVQPQNVKMYEKDYILNTNDLTTRDFSLALGGAPWLSVKFSKDSKYVLYFWGKDSDSTLRVKRITDNQPVFYYLAKHFNYPSLFCFDVSNDNQYFLSSINNKIAKIRFRKEPTDVIVKIPGTDEAIKPNPGSNVVEIGINTDLIINRIELSNASGVKVANGFKIIENIPGKIMLDVSGLNNGMYMVTLISSNSMFTKKLIINR
jgi:hypothetical protein